ncbi:MAG: pyridoxamine 5'-phosphate oxidase family protein [Armatimonadetes bacterium]|nr:pyridoxamine 5'-phosphate oxidase family protein [Armatimonadota bacterium]
MADNERAHLLELLGKFKTGMLVTRAADGHLRARPMMIALTEQGGELWFATDIHSPKIAEIEAAPEVNLALMEGDAYLSLSGTAQVVRDPAKVAELWNEAWRVWFDGGPDDPDLVLLRFDPSDGEYWDNQGTNKLRFLVQAARAYLKGEELREGDESQHGEARL